MGKEEGNQITMYLVQGNSRKGGSEDVVSAVCVQRDR